MKNLLSSLPQQADPNLLVGFETSDDAGVYQLNDTQAIVTTADFITPPADDPRLFGQIAAANALSDVYAMGGRPFTCLNLLAFPANKLGQEILHGIIAGAAEKILEAGAVLAGGHSIEDEEPKFGLAVTGMVHPQKIWRNNGAQVGDALLLTKPLGSGVLLNANLKGWVSQEAIEECFRQLATLNRVAAETLQAFNVHAATDITGFGLAGHALEIAQGSKVTIEIETQNLPWLPEAAAMYERGMTTGTNQANRKLVEDDFEFPAQQVMQELLVDPQTSGGLLVSLPAEEAETALSKLHEAGVSNACLIGQVITRGNKGIRFF